MKQNNITLKGILFSLFLFASYFANAGNYTWTGTTSSSWITTTNWNPNGTPSISDTVLITSGSNNCELAGNTTVKLLKVTDDTLDLKTHTLTVGDDILLDNGLISNGKLKQTNGQLASFVGGTVTAIVEVTANSIVFSGSTFTNSVVAIKKSSTISTGLGGCTFLSTVTLIDSGSGEWTFANQDPDTCYDVVTVKESGTGTIYFAHNSTGNSFEKSVTFLNYSTGTIHCDFYGSSTFHDSIIINAPDTGWVYFGRAGGTTVLDTSIIVAGSHGLSSVARLVLGGILQLDATKEITLSGSDNAGIFIERNSEFNGRLTISAPEIGFSDARFLGVTHLTSFGSGANGNGGCYFGDSAVITNTTGVSAQSDPLIPR